jgi:hypothetical protein
VPGLNSLSSAINYLPHTVLIGATLQNPGVMALVMAIDTSALVHRYSE